MLINWKKFLAFTCPFVALGSGASLLLNHITNGWFFYYAYYLPGQASIVPSQVYSFWVLDIFRALPVAVLASAFFFVSKGRRLPTTQRASAVSFYGALAASSLAVAWAATVRSGGGANSLMPAYAALAILFGLGLHSWLGTRAGRQRSEVISLFVIGAVALQFVILLYNPYRFLPSRSDLAVGDRLREVVSQYQDDVYLPYRGFLTTGATKSVHAHWFAFYDLMVSRNESDLGRDLMIASLRSAFREKRFGAVILDSPSSDAVSPFWADLLAGSYVRDKKLFDDPNLVWPRAGSTKPQWVFVPIK